MIRLWNDRRAALGVTLLATMVLLAAAAPLVTSGAPTAQHHVAATRFLPPLTIDRYHALHLLGTDRFGRDIWTRLVYGARISLSVSALAVLLSVVLGVAVGATAGYAPRGVSVVLLGVTDFALALPRVVLLLLLASLWQPSTTLVILVLGCTGWMTVARLVYARSSGPRRASLRGRCDRPGGAPQPSAVAAHPPQRVDAGDRGSGTGRG